MGKPDVVYEIHEAETSYRVQPNTDATPGEGYEHGATLVWSDNGAEWQWKAQFFVAREAMEAIGMALIEAAKSTKQMVDKPNENDAFKS